MTCWPVGRPAEYMTLIKVRHYYESGIGNNVGDVWSEDNPDEDWSEAQCREYVEAQEANTYVLDHNEYARPDYYVVDEVLPDWSDGGWYDYDKCESKDKDGATCDAGCHECPYEASCYKLQRNQQIAWIKAHGVEL